MRIAPGSGGVDAWLQVAGPDGRTGRLAVQAKGRLEPREVQAAAAQLRSQAPKSDVLVWAPFLGPRTRELLTREGVSYADATGNIWISLRTPAVFISAPGADKDPDRTPRPLASLKGRAAGMAVRALADFSPPYGVRELAQRSGTALGSLARVVDLLDREAIVARDPRGRILEVRLSDLVRRWARDYSVDRSNDVRPYFDPRGVANLERALRSFRGRWCLTGALAAARRAAAAPARLAVLYADDAMGLAAACGLREAAGGGANVLVAQPYDPVVFERTWTQDGLTFAALPQVAVDVMTGPGRGAAEAEELLAWMEEHTVDWRA